VSRTSGKLHTRSAEPQELHLWAFDLLAVGGRDLRDRPLGARRERLLARFDCPAALFSEGFSDPARLLQEAERLKLEGIVSKRRSAPYRSGEGCGWHKVKTAAWREANRERYRLFEKALACLDSGDGMELALVSACCLRGSTTHATRRWTNSDFCE
jgi:ATP-dependent DNA ligase